MYGFKCSFLNTDGANEHLLSLCFMLDSVSVAKQRSNDAVSLVHPELSSSEVTLA